MKFYFIFIGINFALYFGCNQILMGEMNEWDCVGFFFFTPSEHMSLMN